MSLTSAAVVAVLAVVAPLLVRVIRLPIPELVLLILLGSAVGPQGLEWAHNDEPVKVLSTIGLSFLLFIAGLEIQFDQLRGPVAWTALKAFAASAVLAVVVGFFLGAVDLVKSPSLIAVILLATALGIIIPVLKDNGIIDTTTGKVVVAGASLAEVVPVVALSLLFSEKSHGIGSQITLLITFAAMVAVIGLVFLGLQHWRWISESLQALQETTAEIRVRAAVALLMGFSALATAFGLEAILGAFFAGATISLIDRDRAMTHRLFRVKIQAVGFGALIPYFFVSTGMALDVRAFISSGSTLAKVPIFLGAILLVRAVPALLYRSVLNGRKEMLTAGLLQSTTLSIPVVGGTIGVTLNLIRPQNYVALVAAALLSVVIFPLVASYLVKQPSKPSELGSS
ncbi:cation:proton antiporter (plasmid) [Streptomyces sp. AHU1]|uniref:cation:proton antiporter n=1 Tax=Streptomyces sp. AHU1 TaxID=3377215 RepID=UPI003877A7F9